MSFGIALAVGVLAGAHTSTWGMYKDSPYEGFAWRKYSRSIVVSALVALAWQAAAGFDLALAGARVVLFGLTYVTERGLVELYKTYIREEDQSKYFIPMQFHVMGRVVRSRRARWSVAAVWVATVLAVAGGLRALQGREAAMPGWAAVLLIGSIGGWLSAVGGAFKDAPIEGFESFKFFRSPAVALAWSALVACFSRDYLHVALGGLGYTVASIETYKTFFFPNKPRGKFAGKPIRFPAFLTWRYRFAPLYAAIWLAVGLNIALAFSEPRQGLLSIGPGLRALADPPWIHLATFLYSLAGGIVPFLLASATTGIPPFYATSVAAGLVRFPLRSFLALGLCGRMMRFAALFLLPRML